MGEESVAALREVGKLLAYLKEPAPPKGLQDVWEKLPMLNQPGFRLREQNGSGCDQQMVNRNYAPLG